MVSKKYSGVRVDVILIIILVMMLFIFFIIGWGSNDIYKGITNQRLYSGMRFESSNNHSLALSLARSYDSSGDWVCVNIKGMEYKRAIEVINHEVGHEIFAKECEKDITKCLGVIDG